MADEPGTGTGTGTGTGAPWHQGVEGIDADLMGHMQNKQWDKMTSQQAAVAAARAHREAEKMIGVPANQLVRLPTDANDANGWNAVWSRLGKPTDAKDYDFSAVKIGDKPLEQGVADFLRQSAFALNLSKDGALRYAQEYAKHQTDTASAALADRTATVAAQRDELKANWKVNYDANMLVAQAAAKALGVSEAEIAALENTVGYSKTMEMFRAIGSKIGEDKFISSDTPSGGIMTREQAVARMNTLKADSAWAKRYMEGGAAENRELQDLMRIATENGTRAA